MHACCGSTLCALPSVVLCLRHQLFANLYFIPDVYTVPLRCMVFAEQLAAYATQQLDACFAGTLQAHCSRTCSQALIRACSVCDGHKAPPESMAAACYFTHQLQAAYLGSRVTKQSTVSLAPGVSYIYIRRFYICNVHLV